MEGVRRPRRRGSLFSRCPAVCLVLEYEARKDGKEHLIFSSMMKSLSKPFVCVSIYVSKDSFFLHADTSRTARSTKGEEHWRKTRWLYTWVLMRGFESYIWVFVDYLRQAHIFLPSFRAPLHDKMDQQQSQGSHPPRRWVTAYLDLVLSKQ